MIPSAHFPLSALLGSSPCVCSLSDGLSPPGGKVAANSSSLIFSLAQVHWASMSSGLSKSLLVSL